LKNFEDNDYYEENNDFTSYLDDSKNQILMILALGAFPRYVKSSLYKDWKGKYSK
jgi:hypothetical protein